MKRKLIYFLSVLLVLTMVPMTGVAGEEDNPGKQAFDNRIVKQIDVDRIYDHVYHLSENIGPRVAGTEGELETVDYLVDEFESYGYENVEVQPFDTLGFTSYNVIATKEPNNRNQDSGQKLIVGAHHDTVPDSPGANDDASGTGALLELARVMANAPVDTEIRFVAFGAEEWGLVGSRYYAENMTEEEVEDTVGMFQLDMIGSADAGDLTMFTVDGNQNTVTDLAASAGARVSHNDIPPFSMLGRSDHVPFYERGIPAALFIHTPLEPWYHTPEDTIEYISKEKLEDVTKIVGAAVYHAARPDTPALERSNVAPQPVDYYYEQPEL
ncbi:M28 family peptidase [Alkalibacillus haloalkaliphilus]|uniref:M28 family peptidase n=1 Tax=Alkalibacillus haloalkaliphilus TaxID=94136 RepID=UPI0002D53069|nr:M20/M25/M40 family metallo-hydrolase [Alkalibacillus haloalkaliphilus]